MAEQVSSLKTGIKYKDTPIGKIPVDWEVAKLKRIATGFYNGGTPDTTNMDYWDGSIPWITGADFEDQKVKTIRRYITSDGVKNSATNVVPKGNLLIVTRTGVGKVAIAPFDIAISQDITGVILDSQKASPEFIYWYIDFISTKLKSTIQGTSISGLLRGDLEEIDLPLPAIAEQKKIAEILTTFVEAIDKTTQIIEKTKEVKKGLMQKLLTRGIGHKKFKKTEIGEIPEDWEVARLGAVADLKNGINFSKEQKCERGILTIDVLNMYSTSVFIDSTNLYRINIDLRNKEDYILKEGDILFVRSSLKKEGIGWASLFKSFNEPATFCGFIIRARIHNKKLTPEFLIYFLRSNRVRERLISGAGQVAITNISQATLESLDIVIPSLSEQKQIAEILSSVDEEIDKETNRQEQLELLKKGLMQVLLTGKVRVLA
jgi:type I restriction enzyme S subunit